MPLELIFENSFAKVEYDRVNQVLRPTYYGVVNQDKGIESFQAVLDVLDKTPLRGAIFDCMLMNGTFSKMNDWLTKVWYPSIIPRGYVCWSLATNDMFTKFAGNLLINKFTPKEITAKIFDSMEEAEKWVYNFLDITV